MYLTMFIHDLERYTLNSIYIQLSVPGSWKLPYFFAIPWSSSQEMSMSTSDLPSALQGNKIRPAAKLPVFLKLLTPCQQGNQWIQKFLTVSFNQKGDTTQLNITHLSLFDELFPLDPKVTLLKQNVQSLRITSPSQSLLEWPFRAEVTDESWDYDFSCLLRTSEGLWRHKSWRQESPSISNIIFTKPFKLSCLKLFVYLSVWSLLQKRYGSVCLPWLNLCTSE